MVLTEPDKVWSTASVNDGLVMMKGLNDWTPIFWDKADGTRQTAGFDPPDRFPTVNRPDIEREIMEELELELEDVFMIEEGSEWDEELGDWKVKKKVRHAGKLRQELELDVREWVESHVQSRTEITNGMIVSFKNQKKSEISAELRPHRGILIEGHKLKRNARLGYKLEVRQEGIRMGKMKDIATEYEEEIRRLTEIVEMKKAEYIASNGALNYVKSKYEEAKKGGDNNANE